MSVFCTWPIFALLMPMAFNGNCEQIGYDFQIHFQRFLLEAWAKFEKPCPNGTKMLILTLSRRDGFDKRRGIRTWMKDAVFGEELRFLVSDPSKDEANDVQQKLDEEQKEHGDLVLLHGFVDLYAHLHLKWYGGLVWQQRHCAETEWVAKVDDDIAVHLQRLNQWIDKKFRKNAAENPLVYIGIGGNPRPKRDPDNKWYVSYETYSRELFPPYVYGGCYLTTAATVKAVMALTHKTNGFFLDDVLYTGVLGELANAIVLDQPMHFEFEAKTECVDHVPTLFSIWNAKNGDETIENYEKLKAMKC